MTEYRSPNFPALFIDDSLELRSFDRNLINALGDWDFNMRGILQGGISFIDNMDISIVDFTSSGTPNAENTVAHQLGKIPTGYIVVGKDKAAHLYNGTTAWTATNLYVKSDVATVALKIMVF